MAVNAHEKQLNRVQRSIRQFFKTSVVALVLAASTQPALAEPIAGGQTLKIIAPSAPGGAVDTVARLAAQKIGAVLNQNIVVENKPGASGMIASDYVARSKADGTILLLGSVQTHGINPSLFPTISYDAKKDFVPVGLLVNAENVLTVNPSSPYHTLDDIIKAAKAKPGTLTLGTGGNGTSGDLSGVRLEKMAGIQLVRVPYKGGSPALNDLMGNQIDMVFDSFATALPMIKAGKLRAIAVPSQQRTRALPDVPTFIESGFDGFESYGWCMLLAPAGTPDDVVDKLNAAMNQALQDPELRQRLTDIEFPVKGGSRRDAVAYMDSEIAKWGELVKSSGATAH